MRKIEVNRDDPSAPRWSSKREYFSKQLGIVMIELR